MHPTSGFIAILIPTKLLNYAISGVYKYPTRGLGSLTYGTKVGDV